MTSALPEPGSLWVFRGTGVGVSGEIHQVVESNQEGIVTWGRDRHSWLGSPEDFVAQFQPMEEVK